MFGSEFYGFAFWWIFPLVMVVLCFFMMRGRGCMMSRHDTQRTDGLGRGTSDSAMDILDKRYALGEINREEYEERKRALNSHT